MEFVHYGECGQALLYRSDNNTKKIFIDIQKKALIDFQKE